MNFLVISVANPQKKKSFWALHVWHWVLFVVGLRIVLFGGVAIYNGYFVTVGLMCMNIGQRGYFAMGPDFYIGPSKSKKRKN